MEALKTTLQSIRHKQPISKDIAAQIFHQGISRATFEVLSTIFSLTTPASAINDSSARSIIVLEQLAIAISQLTNLPEPSNNLALFRKDLFYQQCREDDQYKMLLNKVYGLFPTIDIRARVPLLLQFDASICDGEEIGNPNWLLTRSIMTQWIEKNRESLCRQSALSCYILLSHWKLLQIAEGWPIWDCLWAVLYLWLTRTFLQPFRVAAGEAVRGSWCAAEGIELRRMILRKGQLARRDQQKALYYLILFAVQQYVLGEESEYFSLAVKHYESAPFSSWQQLLTLQLMKRTANALQHDQLTLQCQKFISNSIKKTNIDNNSEFQYLLPHILPKNQVRDYILNHKLQFWKYDLQLKICEDIAQEYMKNLPDFEQEWRVNIISHLSKEYLVENLLCSLEKKGKKIGKIVVRTLQHCCERIASKIHKYIETSEKQCINDLRLFATQWDNYYVMEIEKIDNSNRQACFDFLTFQRNQLSEFFQWKVCFPQQSLPIFAEILNNLTDHLLGQAEGECSITPLVLNNTFVEYFSNLREQSRDKLWAKWGELMLRDECILEQLMAIAPAGAS